MNQTDTSMLPFALDYGLQNGPVVLAKDQSLDEFTDSLTNVKMDYDYSNVEKTYDSRSFFEELADDTSDVVKQTSGFVWNTATGTWDAVKYGAGEIANSVSDAGTKLLAPLTDFWDNMLVRLFLVFAALVAGLYILGKAGLLKDIASIVKEIA